MQFGWLLDSAKHILETFTTYRVGYFTALVIDIELS